MEKGRDFWWHEEAPKVPSYCAPEVMNSEDPLFILYVSLPGECNANEKRAKVLTRSPSP